MKIQSNQSASLRQSIIEPLAMAVVVTVLVASGFVALRNIRELQASRARVGHTLEIIATLRSIETGVMNVQSSQRGYLITGDSSHLKAMDDAVKMTNQSLGRLDELTLDNPVQHAAIDPLKTLVQRRLDELQNVLDVRAREGARAASDTVARDYSKRTMQQIITKTDEMRTLENELLLERQALARHAYRSGIATSIISTIIGVVLVCSVLYLIERNRRKALRAASEIERIRERLLLALSAAELGSWNIHPDTETLVGDARFRKIFTGTEDEITYSEAFTFVHTDDRERIRAAVSASMDPRNPVPYAEDYRVIHRDGTLRWVQGKGRANFTGEGSDRHLTSLDGTVADVTERKLYEERLREGEQIARAANQSKSEFLANMSHEIRTPMAAILGYADVLLGHLENPDNRNCVMIIKRNGQHLLELINDILDLSRIEAGKMDVETEQVSLVRLIRDVQSLMQVRAEEKSLEFRAEFLGKVPKQIKTDPTRLRQVLINLIGNAIKFTKEGSVVLAVAYEASQLRISVTDTGIGMNDEQQSKLFKPFSQGDSSVTRSFGGSGLGLAISKRLVGMLGGDIEVQSKLGRGSTFTTVLPIESGEGFELVEATLETKPPESKDLDDGERRLNCRVLVVDDRRDVRHISQHFLEKAGATVMVAEDGQEGIDKSMALRDSETPIDLIVMDMQMPKVDGLQATARLRAAGVRVPIIALTADAMKGDRDKCLQGGCDDYLSKPIDHVRLVRMVAKYTQDLSVEDLDRRRQERLDQLKLAPNELP